MPTIQISYTALKEELGSQLSIAELEQALFDMGLELESVIDDQLAVEITAERLDLLSLQGLARAIKSFLGLSPVVPKYRVLTGDDSYVVRITPHVKDVRPYTVCAIVKNLGLTPNRIKEIIDVQEKLHATLGRMRSRGAIGIYPLEHISLPITYTAGSPDSISFIPLGESVKMTASQILTETDTGKTYAHLLDGEKVFPYFVDAKGDILSLPPIINSEKTGRVMSSTTELFIECSGFDLLLLQELLTNIATLFADMGGDIYALELQYPDKKLMTPNLASKQKSFSTKSLEQYIGLTLSLDELKVLLRKMMYEFVDAEYKDDGEIILHVTAPPFREDLWHEIDIIEDIARSYGYNNLPLTFPSIATIASQLPLSLLKEEIASLMVGMGFLETYTFGLTSKQEQLDNMRLSEKVNFMPVSNGNEMQNMLRVSLLPELLKCLVHNRTEPLPQKIFESSFVIIPDVTKDVRCRNELHCSGLLADKKVTFTQLRQVVEALFRGKGKEISFAPIAHPSFISGRVGAILLEGETVGVLGEIHPEVLENFGLITPVVAFEINLEAM